MEAVEAAAEACEAPAASAVDVADVDAHSGGPQTSARSARDGEAGPESTECRPPVAVSTPSSMQVGGRDAGSAEEEAANAENVSALRPQQTAELCRAEVELLQMLRAETHMRRKQSLVVPRLAAIFDALPAASGAVQRCRAALDSSLVFRADGSAADLRSLVFEDVSSRCRRRILARIGSTCAAPPPDRPGFVVFSDVDDTLLPGADALSIGGCDRSWHLDGRLYPGVSRLHRELRQGLREEHGCEDYSVLLTARPPSMVSSLGHKCRRLTGLRNPRLAILPGESGTVEAAMNAFRVLAGKYQRLGEVKVQRMQEYRALFPEYAGRFVFIGDDGQADVQAAEKMLAMRAPCTPSASSSSGGGAAKSRPVVAFAAIHACYNNGQPLVPEEQRMQTLRRMRTLYPGQQKDPSRSADVSCAARLRHRFFYFDDYIDLAEQLSQAGWLEAQQRDAVVKAASIDFAPDPLRFAESCDLLGLQAALEAKRAVGAFEHGDETEQECLAASRALLPHVAAAHLRLSPPQGACVLVIKVLEVHLSGCSWKPAAGCRPAEDELPLLPGSKGAPGMAGAAPPIALVEIPSAAPNGSVGLAAVTDKLDKAIAAAAAARVEFQPDGVLVVPWPCAVLCQRSGEGRAAIDVGGGFAAVAAAGAAGWRAAGRCFVVIGESSQPCGDGSEASSSELRDGQSEIAKSSSPSSEMTVALVEQSSKPSPASPVGRIVFSVTWHSAVKPPPEAARASVPSGAGNFL